MKTQKTATTTLRAAGSTLLLTATQKATNVVTTVTTIAPDKKATPGMTEVHADMDAAKAHIAQLVAQAEKLGWAKRQPTFTARPDAFTSLPTPPAASEPEGLDDGTQNPERGHCARDGGAHSQS